MSCSKTKLISVYIDAELQDSNKAALETHLQGCAQCGTALKDAQSLHSAFANAERHQAPYGFATRVMARTADLEKKKAPWLVPFFVRFAEAAALVIVITIGILAGTVMTSERSAVTAANIASSLSLDLFDAAPPGSLGGAYLAMTEVKNEK